MSYLTVRERNIKELLDSHTAKLAYLDELYKERDENISVNEAGEASLSETIALHEWYEREAEGIREWFASEIRRLAHPIYRIHFVDNYGQGMVECRTREEYSEKYKALRDDPECEDIWVESYNFEEGYWEA